MKERLCAALAALLAICGHAAVAPAPLADYGSPGGDKLAYVAVAGDSRRVVITRLGGADIIALNVEKYNPPDVAPD